MAIVPTSSTHTDAAAWQIHLNKGCLELVGKQSHIVLLQSPKCGSILPAL